MPLVGLGVGVTDQVLPFHDSTRGTLVDPVDGVTYRYTATRTSAGHATEVVASGVGIRAGND